LDITVTGVKNNNQLDVESGGDTIPPGSVVMVANCATGADLFQQSDRNNDGANPTRPSMSCSENGPGNKPPGPNPWGTAHDESSSVYTLTTVAYYVGMNDDLNEPALYRHDLTGGTTEEIVSGIENLQILYGYSNPADEGGDGQTVNHWLPANEVPNWEFVIGARLSFLVRSPENMGDGTLQRTFDLAGTNITHQEDGRLRQPFLASISLRNQQLVM
jgi:type IV pilus assembly protein PilW